VSFLEELMKISYSKPVFGLIILVALILSACAPVGAPSTGPVATLASGTTSLAPTPTNPVAPTTTLGAAPLAGATGTSAASSSSGVGIKYVIDPTKSEASYSVREQLAKLSLPSDAIGKTNGIAGSITLNAEGTVDSANSNITVDLSTLKTDESMRDNFVRRNVLQIDQYPQAVFVPTQLSGLPAAIPQSGSVTFKVTGNLTIRNVTKPVTWDVTGTVTNGAATGTATTSFTFEDFNLTQPHVSVVLSVVDKITLNVMVKFQREGN
jgi:polyisoprenoid-binding protein YceI